MTWDYEMSLDEASIILPHLNGAHIATYENMLRSPSWFPSLVSDSGSLR